MQMLPFGKEMLVVLLGYAVGCFTAGYYVVRWRTGRDVRQIGSGTAGATNAGRILGPPGFLLVLFVDFFKGVLAVGTALWLKVEPSVVVLTVLAVVAGHLWPAQLRFGGGKGVATSLGALVTFNPWMALAFASLFAAAFVALRSYVLAGLLAFTGLPLALLAMGFPRTSVLGMSVLALLILIAHRRNIPVEIHALFGKDSKSNKWVVSK